MADEWETRMGVLLGEFEELVRSRARQYAPSMGRTPYDERVDQARAAIIAHARKGRESGWRTMESAPRDGTRILVAGEPESGVVEARWFEEPEHRNAGFLAYYGNPKYDPGCYISPTHWMPLPAPPAPSSEAVHEPGEGA